MKSWPIQNLGMIPKEASLYRAPISDNERLGEEEWVRHILRSTARSETFLTISHALNLIPTL